MPPDGEALVFLPVRSYNETLEPFMDYLVYAKKSGPIDVEGLVKGKINAVAMGAVGRRLPLALAPGDRVYFAVDGESRNGPQPQVVAKAIVKDVDGSAADGFDPKKEFARRADLLGFCEKDVKKWSSKKHVQIVEFAHAVRTFPFGITLPEAARSGWSPVGYINRIRIA